MLADDVLTFIKSDLIRSMYGSDSLNVIEEFLLGSMRFSFDEPAASAAAQVTRSRPSSLLSALKFFKLPYPMIAAVCLLNSKNCVSVTSEDLSALNRFRERRGRQVLLPYHNVKVSLSNVDRSRSQSESISKIEQQRHLVRGHFKIRRSGIYWWRSFIRGTIGPVVPTRYAVAS